MTDIHAYNNGNGRTAACWMNVIVASFGKKTFLLRHEGERQNPESSYAKAIKYIDDQPNLLQAHILARLQAANELNGESPRPEHHEAKATSLRLRSRTTLLQIQKKYPNFDLETYDENISKDAEEAVEKQSFTEVGPELIYFGLRFYYQQFLKLLVQLKTQQPSTQRGQEISSPAVLKSP